MTPPALVLEAARAEDLEALVDLERRCHSHAWSARSFQEELEDTARGRVVVLRAPLASPPCGRGIVGYCAYRVAAEEMHVLNLAVAPEHRRAGLGRFLLARALEQGTRRGAERAFLEVRRSNREARALYEGFGFVTLVVRRDYYADPREDALVLARRLPGPAAPTRAAAP